MSDQDRLPSDRFAACTTNATERCALLDILDEHHTALAEIRAALKQMGERKAEPTGETLTGPGGRWAGTTSASAESGVSREPSPSADAMLILASLAACHPGGDVYTGVKRAQFALKAERERHSRDEKCISILDRSIEKLSDDLTAEKRAHEAARTELARTIKTLSLSEGDVLKLQSERTQLTRDLEQARREHESLNKLYYETGMRADRAEATVEARDSEIDELNKELSNVRSGLDVLANQRDIIQAQAIRAQSSDRADMGLREAVLDLVVNPPRSGLVSVGVLKELLAAHPATLTTDAPAESKRETCK